jgi:phytoene/squalene synthetase
MIDACAQTVERGDPARFRANMAAPVAARARLWPIYAFNLECARAPWATREPMVAEMRLQFWVDVADGTLASPRHETATPFATLLAELGPEARALAADIANARRHDCWPEPFADEAALIDYLDRTGGALMQLAALALGRATEAARLAGRALALARYLQAVPELESRGRLPLPDGRPHAVQALAEQGLAWLDAARATVGITPRAALLPAHAARPLLRRAAQVPGRVADGTLGLPHLTDSLSLAGAALLGRF